MLNIQLLGNRVAIEKATKMANKNETTLFVDKPEIADNFGIVKFIGTSVEKPQFQVGDHVYYGNRHEFIRMAGGDFLVMEPENVFAKTVQGMTDEKEAE